MGKVQSTATRRERERRHLRAYGCACGRIRDTRWIRAGRRPKTASPSMAEHVDHTFLVKEASDARRGSPDAPASHQGRRQSTSPLRPVGLRGCMRRPTARRARTAPSMRSSRWRREIRHAWTSKRAAARKMSGDHRVGDAIRRPTNRPAATRRTRSSGGRAHYSASGRC